MVAALSTSLKLMIFVDIIILAVLITSFYVKSLQHAVFKVFVKDKKYYKASNIVLTATVLFIFLVTLAGYSVETEVKPQENQVKPSSSTEEQPVNKVKKIEEITKEKPYDEKVTAVAVKEDNKDIKQNDIIISDKKPSINTGSTNEEKVEPEVKKEKEPPKEKLTNIEDKTVKENIADTEKKYQMALKIFRAKKYKEAIDLFRKLGDYKQSNKYVVKSVDGFKWEKYLKAIKLYKKKKYGNSYLQFKELEDYKESGKYLKKLRKILTMKQEKYYGQFKNKPGILLAKIDRWNKLQTGVIEFNNKLGFKGVNKVIDMGLKALVTLGKSTNYEEPNTLPGSELFQPLFAKLGLKKDIYLRILRGKDEFEKRDYIKIEYPNLKRKILADKYMVAAKSELSEYDFKKRQFRLGIPSYFLIGSIGRNLLYHMNASLKVSSKKLNYFIRFKNDKSAKEFKDQNKQKIFRNNLVTKLIFKVNKVNLNSYNISCRILGYKVMNKKTDEVLVVKFF